MRDISQIRTLIVDDNAEWLASLTILLAGEGMQVIDTASRGTEAVRKAEETRPALVLMDVNLPDQTGIEVCRTIRRLVPTCAVIFVTASDYPEIAERARAAGASGFVSKWRVVSDLLPAIHVALGK
jgi:DNA-binding NarL/FixJ family response regulator